MFLTQRQAPSDPSSLSYLYGCGGKGKAIAVDVHQEDVDWFIEQAKIREVEINTIIDTHIHADHISGGRELANKCGGTYMLHESSTPNFEFSPLQDEQLLVSGNVMTKILHTPGHTMDSVCLLVSDTRRTSEPWFLISGHTLFVGSAGRPDLKGQEEKMARLLYHSINEKILTLPGHVEIYPGAQAGSVCGAGLSAKPCSTISFERRFNTSLKENEDNFIKSILDNIPSKPINMPNIVQKNSQ
ncbi:MBL fold metallo-hydrolase [Bathymodiolus septemdierum thioautotrophic gill symbiont]|uniref:Eta-lactamase family protein n=1 Tax=endosymbiont of Bathymodiolus septemdierum str. Myojin knoll TaxID=1303921 RepID=A0A0N7KBL7_9GAMM|nr:MBL fold metallo-hydrolase [Bathymodiolus septemdierum thioautotrophic gill symbiont]BAS68367.1 eta-lactamase family protein [endosymbiont of Bathymodiolus septemdierum str. Myojin knoll]